ncbi:MAG: hypothetical protein M3P26_12890 [Gemmatimonadota bacterium]|nr:hypothetical protein [Gemmatimonadota bacterium]
MPQKRVGPLSASENTDYGDTGPHSVGSHMVHISGTWTGNFVTKGYLKGNGLGVADRQPVAYKNMKTGVVTDPTVTAITANGVYEVVTDGLNLVMDFTYATGTGPIVDVQPLRG